MSTKTCPVCDTENEIGAKHCEMCGEPLPIPQIATDAPPPAPSIPEPSPAPAPVAPAPTTEPAPEVTEPVAPADPPLPEVAASLDLDDAGDLAGFGREASDTIVDMRPPDLPDLPDEEPGPTPLPEPVQPPIPASDARIVIYQNKEPAHTHTIEQDETLLGRSDPASDAYPDLDFTPFDAAGATSRKHAFIYREAGRFFVYPISQAGTQLSRDGQGQLLNIGEKIELQDGDVLILAGALAMKFHVD